MTTVKRKKVSVKVSKSAPPAVWEVPSQLKGLSCALCSFPFKAGDTHGALDLVTGVVTCRVVTTVTKEQTLKDTAVVEDVPAVVPAPLTDQPG